MTTRRGRYNPNIYHNNAAGHTSEGADPVEISEVITSLPTDLAPSTSDVTQGVTHEPSVEQVHEVNQVPHGLEMGGHRFLTQH